MLLLLPAASCNLTGSRDGVGLGERVEGGGFVPHGLQQVRLGGAAMGDRGWLLLVIAGSKLQLTGWGGFG